MDAGAGRLREEWLEVAGRDLPIDAESVFPEGDGFLERRAAAARAKLLAGLRQMLLVALEPGERIRYAARGIERGAVGRSALAQLASQIALVLTDRRLLMVQVNRKGAPRDVKNQARLGAIRVAKSGVLSPFEVRLQDGTRLRWAGVPRRDGRTLAARLPERVPVEQVGSGPSLEHLCPACLKVVPGRVGDARLCPNPSCRIPFREPGRAILLSVLMPGLGELYLRHHLLGSVGFLVSLGLLALVAFLAIQAAVIGTGNGEALALLVPAAIVFVGSRAVEYFLVRQMARKGLVPLAERPSPAATRSLPAFPAWSWALFLAGAVGLGFGLLAVEKEARIAGKAVLSRQAARAGRLDEAMARWAEARALGDPGDEARGLLALALFRAGDLEDGERMVSDIGGRRIEKRTADEINELLRRRDAAFADYRKGLGALAEGKPDEAAPALDRAAAYFRTVQRPALPRTRGEAALQLAAALLAPPATAARLAAAARLRPEALEDVPAPRRAVVLAAIGSLKGEKDRAAALLREADPAELPDTWKLLALETRLRLATSEAERRAVAEEAGRIPSDRLEEQARVRLAALSAAR
jgi:hypothetical protein